MVLEGSADIQKTNELQAADSYDIGPRGQLVAASDLSAFDNIKTSGTALNPLYGMESIGAAIPVLVATGDEGGQHNIAVYTLPAGAVNGGVNLGAVVAGGMNVTFASFPFVTVRSPRQVRVVLVCVGARSAFTPRSQYGLYAVLYDPSAVTFGTLSIGHYDALGTGPNGEFGGGSMAVQLFPRWCIAYNNFAFLFGFDNHDATDGDGPNRVMFSNLGNPLKYGLDPQEQAILDGAPETDRAFTDSDAFTIGGAGEIARGGCVWSGKLFVGTNKGLHYIEGFGRESFLTNGAIPIRRSRNVIGPHAMVEGSDGLLYGVADDIGLWSYDGSVVEPIGIRLQDFASKSNGFWDLVWTDTSRTLAQFPGQTNQDLVWMLSDPELLQVWVVIPYCSISNGYGFGADTVVIKYHVATDGFTRQSFAGKILLHGTIFQREQTAIRQRFICAPGMTQNIQVYRQKANASVSPIMPSVLPDATFGEYAPHGPDGVGVTRKIYITIAWESASSLPLVFTVTPMADQKAAGSVIVVTITASGAPGTPADGDVWIDTSGTDTNLGNGTAGVIIPASPNDYLVRRWAAGRAKWDYMWSGGQQGTRMSIPVAYVPHRAARVKYRVQCTSAAGRFQLEDLGIEAATIRPDR